MRKPAEDGEEAQADQSLYRSRARGDHRAPPGPVVAAASPGAVARSEAAARRVAGDMISDVDKRRIVEAIQGVEQKTAGEIFCVVARGCGDYRLVPIAWAAIIALAVPLPGIYLTTWPAGIIYLIQLIVFIVSALVLSLPMIRFRIVPKRRMWGRAHAEAMRQFLAQGLHLTEQRTGVLIFASVIERYAEIVADSTINAKVNPDVWAGAIAAMITAIKDGRPADGFVAAVQLCGAELARHFPPGTLNPNALPDKVVEI